MNTISSSGRSILRTCSSKLIRNQNIVNSKSFSAISSNTPSLQSLLSSTKTSSIITGNTKNNNTVVTIKNLRMPLLSALTELYLTNLDDGT